MVDAIQRHEKAYEQAHRKVDENTEVYALIIKQVNGNMTHVCTKADDSKILSRYNYQLLQKQDMQVARQTSGAKVLGSNPLASPKMIPGRWRSIV